ncbi:MAG: enoyl-CoA hydratase/isomerase family protein [Acidimicrobiales bacterium]
MRHPHRRVHAHLVRLLRSPARLLAAIGSRTTANLHGACMGSGIELAAFAGHVAVAPDVLIALPEVGLGLIPGAGGTVSLPARIGRHRTAWLALTGRSIDAPTALAWHLADQAV